MDENNLFREAFSVEVARDIGGRLAGASSDFDQAGYLSRVLPGYEALGFGERARRIVEGLEATLPADFREAASILVRALGPEPPPEAELSGFGGFYVMPLTMYVSRHGMEDPETSLDALYEMTKRFTAESEIRPFILRHPALTMEFLRRLTDDPSPFARRLASEGTRPRLPLAPRLPAFQRDPGPVIALLDRLFHDPSPMVRRSVANNLNDISKDNPGIAVATLARWRGKRPGEETDALVRHALRTLLKRGDPEALSLLGFGSGQVVVEDWSCGPGALRLGESLEFSCLLRSESPTGESLAINYILHFIKAKGRRSPKVFRMPDKTLAPRGELRIRKVHQFRPYRNQRFYSGLHRVELSVNGRVLAGTDFHLDAGTGPAGS